MLDKDQIVRHISEGQYEIDENTRMLGRCFVGRYENTPQLPAISMPGGDIGNLAILYAAANIYGFQIDYDKALNIFLDLIGGVQNFSLHTEVRDQSHSLDGCDHTSFLKNNTDLYDLTNEQIKILEAQLAFVTNKHAQTKVLSDRKSEEAVVIVTGSKALYPQYHFMSESGTVSGNIYIFHRTFIEQRNREFIKKLLEYSAIQFNIYMNEEYLLEALTEVSENHFFETIKKLPSHIPLYAVEFGEQNNFIVELL